MEPGIVSGDGTALIKYVVKDRINLALNNVRYIKDCAAGNASNEYKHWYK